MSLLTRVEKLEAGSSGAPAVIFQQPWETEAQARERWKMEHPDRELSDVMVIGWMAPGAA